MDNVSKGLDWNSDDTAEVQTKTILLASEVGTTKGGMDKM